MCQETTFPDLSLNAPCAEALAAIGESNADNWVVMQKGLPLLIAMLQAQDLRQAEAAVSPHSLAPMLDLETDVGFGLQLGSISAGDNRHAVMDSASAAYVSEGQQACESQQQTFATLS